MLARIMLPLLTLVALAAALMGMLNSLHHFFIPALSPAMFNVVTIVVRRSPFVPFAAALRHRADHAHRARHAARRRGAAGAAVAAAAARGLPLATGARLARSRACAGSCVLMGPGTIGLAATQVNVFVNTLLATRRGHRRRVVAELRVPHHVSADRPLRRLDRHRGAADGVAAHAPRAITPACATRSPTACR